MSVGLLTHYTTFMSLGYSYNFEPYEVSSAWAPHKEMHFRKNHDIILWGPAFIQ